MINRRGLITGLVSLIAAPAIVRVGSIMPVKSFAVVDGEVMFDVDSGTIVFDPINFTARMISEYGITAGSMRQEDIMRLDSYLRAKWGL